MWLRRQARRVEAAVIDPRTVLEMSLNDEPRPSTGMIPSQQLEEKRKAFVRPEFDYSQKSCENLARVLIVVFTCLSSHCCILFHFSVIAIFCFMLSAILEGQ